MTKRSGFTLIELMIVAAAFSVIFLVATTVYSNSFRQHRKIQTTQRNASDARAVLETIAREIRISTVNMEPYLNGDLSVDLPSSFGMTPYLSLIHADGSLVCFGYWQTTIRTSADCLDLFTTGKYSTISPPDIKILDLHFFIQPVGLYNDIPQNNPPNIQPTVTIFLKTSTQRGSETSVTSLQTTVVSRLYKR